MMRVPTHCHTLPYTATHCNTLQHTSTQNQCETCCGGQDGGACAHTLQHTTKYCNKMQHIAKHCNTLQHTATHCNTLQHTATPRNTLQQTTKHCNTLQHTATLLKCVAVLILFFSEYSTDISTSQNVCALDVCCSAVLQSL